MTAPRKQPAPAVSPGEPEAPTSGGLPEERAYDLPEEEAPRDVPEQGPAVADKPAAEAPADKPAPEAPEDHEQKIERDLDELSARAEKADEYLELAQRTKADFENYRRRAAREAAAAQERGLIKLARELLPAVDNLDRALAAAQTDSDGAGREDEEATLISGIELVQADVMAALARVGIEPYSPDGEPFDPEWHEAVAQQPVEGAPAGMVVEVYQRGYRLGDNVLRPARVVVAA